MMNFKSIIGGTAVLVLLAISCQKPIEEGTIPDEKQLLENPESAVLARKLIKNSDEVDISLEEIQSFQNNLNNNEDIDGPVFGKFRAVLYRFYKNIKIENGQMVPIKTSAKEVGISPTIFNFYIKDMERLNKEVKAMGIVKDDSSMAKQIEEYLNALVDPTFGNDVFLKSH
ncbi:hypothetical protein [Sphingobacterium corticibacter]|uniref:Lipoprotein n=1 Tax=Sphingobacterium corticibacter TaxID=2171749 RepID=A0A2T8HEK0_9SPHI|nr:hypothetical protein [Sphingobacterium corticibacter]PVH23859.1 hypothetical protein DC487_17060 [Sphingobacterium corticibacter]